MAEFNGSITLATVEDGGDASSYSIEAKKSNIYKFIQNNTVSFSSNEYDFQVYKLTDDVNTLQKIEDYFVDFDITADALVYEKILEFSKRLVCYEFAEDNITKIYYHLENRLFTTDSVNERNIINISEFINVHVEVGDTFDGVTNSEEDVERFNKILEAITDLDSFFILRIYSDPRKDIEDLLIAGIIPVTFGTSEEMAKFEVTATSINALVGDSGLFFDADGLTISKGNFKIISDKDEEIDTILNKLKEHNLVFTQQEKDIMVLNGIDSALFVKQGEDWKFSDNDADISKTISTLNKINMLFGYDPDTQLMRVRGSGTFTGDIYANNGSFTGDVTANTLDALSGNIGGFTIEKNSLVSTNNGVILDGANGKIYAQNIDLGTGAKINDYLKIGDNAFIYNPDLHTGDFIKSGALSINNNGILKLGEITLDAVNSEIYHSKNNEKTFSITPDLASFQNVNVSGKISTIVFETGHVQSVGGAMVFKTSYKIESIEETTLNSNEVLKITLEEVYGEGEETKVQFIGKEGNFVQKLCKVVKVDDKIIYINNPGNLDYNEFVNLISLGKEKDVIVGVNSMNIGLDYLKPRGISVTEVHNDFNECKVFLGDLQTSGIVGVEGYGLYSDNVYLNGSLTTRIGEQGNYTYAGINTLGGTKAIIFDNRPDVENDNSRIVFGRVQKMRVMRQYKRLLFRSQNKAHCMLQKVCLLARLLQIQKSVVQNFIQQESMVLRKAKKIQ